MVEVPSSTSARLHGPAAWTWYQKHSAEQAYTFMDVEQAWMDGMVPAW